MDMDASISFTCLSLPRSMFAEINQIRKYDSVGDSPAAGGWWQTLVGAHVVSCIGWVAAGGDFADVAVWSLSDASLAALGKDEEPGEPWL